MSRKINATTIYSDSEADSETKGKKSDDNEGSDSEDSESFGAHEKLVNSTKIAPKTKPKTPKDKNFNVKLELVKILREKTVSKLRHTLAVKRIPWQDLKIDGYSTEELKQNLQSILKSAGVVRTLNEVLSDYELNQKKYDIACHPDYPSRPETAPLHYVLQNRDKITQHLEKLSPGEKISWIDVMKYGAEKFRNLPEKKKSIYINEYKARMEVFKKQREVFFMSHPELKGKKKKLSEKVRKEKKRVEKVKNPLLLTPFNQYRKELLDQGNPVTLKVAQKMWKELPKEEKGKYVAEVLNSNSEQNKKISKDEMKFLDTHNGMPVRPLAPYNIFVRELKKTYTGDHKDYLNYASAQWKLLDEIEKDRLYRDSDKKMEEYRRKMEAYIRKLPLEQQPMMFSKYNVFQSPVKSRKRKIKGDKEENSKKVDLSSRVKKIQSDSADSADDIPTPTKKPKNGLSPQKPTSPKKKKKLKEPDLPSQTTAHYFMTHVYEGKPKKIAKAYKNLDKNEKFKYRDEVKKLRKQFLANVGDYLNSLDDDEKKTAFSLKIKELKDKQKSDLLWHFSTGTDDEHKKEETSDESGSDSDNS